MSQKCMPFLINMFTAGHITIITMPMQWSKMLVTYIRTKVSIHNNIYSEIQKILHSEPKHI
jgi:hypothetical protein